MSSMRRPLTQRAQYRRIRTEHPQVSVGTVLAARIVFDPVDVVAVGQALCRAFIGAQMRRQLNSSLDVSALRNRSPSTLCSSMPAAAFAEASAISMMSPPLCERSARSYRRFCRVAIVRSSKARSSQKPSRRRRGLRASMSFQKRWRRLQVPTDGSCCEVYMNSGAVMRRRMLSLPARWRYRQHRSVAETPVQHADETKPPTETASASPQRLKQSRQLRILLTSAVVVGGLGIVGVTASLLFNRGAVSPQSVDVSTPANAATPAPPSANNTRPPHTLAARRDGAGPTSAMRTRPSTSANRPAMEC